MNFMLIIEIAAGIVLGIFLAQWIKGLPHKRRVKHYKETLLHLSQYELFRAATDGYDYLFNMTNRALFIRLSYCKDEDEKQRFAGILAEDVADRWDKTKTGKGPELRPLITEHDKELLRKIGETVHRMGETERAMNATRALDDVNVTAEDKERVLRIFQEQQIESTETLHTFLEKIAPGYKGE